MAKYFVNVQEVHEYFIEVEAEDKIDATIKAYDQFKQQPDRVFDVKYLTPIQEWSAEEV